MIHETASTQIGFVFFRDRLSMFCGKRMQSNKRGRVIRSRAMRSHDKKKQVSFVAAEKWAGNGDGAGAAEM